MNFRFLFHLTGVLGVSLCWGLGGPLSWLVTQSIPPAEAAWARCVFAFLGLLPFFVLDGRRIVGMLPWKARALIACSGILLGLHFFFFVSGIVYASLSTTVMLVAADPILILLVGILGFKEKVEAKSFFGIASCILGIGIISILPYLLNDRSVEFAPRRLYGDLCAILAVFTYGLYYASNRAFRAYEPFLSATFSTLRRSFSLASLIYFFGFISSGIFMVVFHLNGSQSFVVPTGKVVLALIASGLIPTLIGHTLNQIVSRKAHPIWVSLMSPGETLIALLIGYLFLEQSIRTVDVIGGVFILFGVVLAIWGEAEPN